MLQFILLTLPKQLSLLEHSDDLVLLEMATVVQIQNFEENVDLCLGYSQGAVSLAVLILGVEVLNQGLELLLV